MTKFWMAKLRISKDNYRFSRSIICVMRLMGLFPMVVRVDHLGVYLQPSPPYLIYSIGLGLFSITYASIGIIKDITVDYTDSVRIRSTTDAFVELFDWGIVHVVAACGFFLIPSRFSAFSRYTKCIGKIDSILHTKHSQHETQMETFLCVSALVAMTTQVTLDYIAYTEVVGENISAWTILNRYGFNYFGCVAMMMTEYEFQYMGSGLTKRLRRLNELLRRLGEGRPPVLVKGLEIFFPKISVLNGLKAPHKKTLEDLNGAWRNNRLYNERLDELMKVYLLVCDGLQYQNDLLGIAGGCAITAASFHLIEALYFLLSDFSETKFLWYFMQVTWLTIHVMRITVIIEPYHACFMEAETTKGLVCKLHYSKVRRYIYQKLRTFTLIMCLRQTTFSLGGTAVVNRRMFNSILGTVSTYLVILLKYNEDETPPK